MVCTYGLCLVLQNVFFSGLLLNVFVGLLERYTVLTVTHEHDRGGSGLKSAILPSGGFRGGAGGGGAYFFRNSAFSLNCLLFISTPSPQAKVLDWPLQPLVVLVLWITFRLKQVT